MLQGKTGIENKNWSLREKDGESNEEGGEEEGKVTGERNRKARQEEDGKQETQSSIEKNTTRNPEKLASRSSAKFGIEVSEEDQLEGGSAEDGSNISEGGWSQARGQEESVGYGLESRHECLFDAGQLAGGGAEEGPEYESTLLNPPDYTVLDESTALNPPDDSFLGTLGDKVQAAIIDIAEEQKKGSERLQDAVKAVGEGIRKEKGEMKEMLTRIQVLQRQHLDTPRRSARLEEKRLETQNVSAEYEWDYN